MMKQPSTKTLHSDISTAMDNLLVIDLIGQAAAFNTPHATQVLDAGGGVGVYTAKLLEYFQGIDITLLDSNRATLKRAKEHLSACCHSIKTIQQDILKADLGTSQYDIIIASRILPYLHNDEEWKLTYKKFYKSLKPGGSLWVSEIVDHSNPYVQTIMWKRYGDHLIKLKDQEFRNHVFTGIEKEDLKYSLHFQLNILGKVGFKEIDVLHKNSVFAAFGGIKKMKR